MKATNKTIVTGLKKRLEEVEERWAAELSNVLWAYCTTPRRSIREMPFLMTYGSEIVIPAKIGLCSMKVSNFTSKKNDTKLAEDLD